jgi:hypothetical protein
MVLVAMLGQNFDANGIRAQQRATFLRLSQSKAGDVQRLSGHFCAITRFLLDA